MVEKKKLESLPNLQIGVSERSNVRMKILAAPRCPVQDDPAKPNYTGEVNCQRETKSYPGWWDLCTNRGHEPYWTIKKTIKKEPIVGEDGVITGYREVMLEKRTLNTVSVPIGTRFSSGRAEYLSKGLKGRKELTEFGFNPKCEYHNCDMDAKVKSKYGMFCNDRHARLIGADVEGMMLDANQTNKNKQLREINVEFEGSMVLQAPPSLDGV